MQLDASQQEDSEEKDNEDFHILVLGPNPPSNKTDVLMDESDFASALDLDPFALNILPEELDSAVNNMQIEGGASAIVPNHEHHMLASPLLVPRNLFVWKVRSSQYLN